MWPTHYLPHLNRPGEPPGRFVLTTPPYPVEATEALLSAGTFERGRFGIGSEEELLASGMPVSGLLRELLTSFDGGLEKLISSGVPVSGLLRVLLVSFDGGFEKLIASGVPVSGVMRDPVIPYVNWLLESDELISSGVPVSGVLA